MNINFKSLKRLVFSLTMPLMAGIIVPNTVIAQTAPTKKVADNGASTSMIAGFDSAQCKMKLQKVGLQFQPKTNDLDAESQASLLPVLDCFKNNRVKILGHSDSKGTPERKLEVSQLRADVVKEFLIKKAIPKAQLTAMGMSDKHPIADNETAEGRAKNRRIEFVLEAYSTTTPAAIQIKAPEVKVQAPVPPPVNSATIPAPVASVIPVAAAPVVAVQTSTVSAVAPAPTETPAATAPVANKGDIAWMLTSTLLVLMMALPGLALFYGGLVRSKNMLSVLMQVMVTFCLILVLWIVYGYSLAFTEGNAFIGSFSRLFLKGITVDSTVATFSKLTVLPEFVFVAFQGTFAAITCTLIVGAFAERAKFSAVLAFMVLWFTFAYLPIAHMVWYWSGPDAYTAIKGVADAETLKAGLLFQWGALDFAGGTVVHINAAIAGLIGAIVVGKRVGFGKENMTPHSLTLSMVGACLLYVGWFGFNAGSALEANSSAALAFINTLVAAAAALLTWTAAEWLHKGKPSMLGGISGAVAGLVAVTPAAGNVSVIGALMIGAIAGPVCLWGVSGLKKLIGADDSLDVFGVHGVGGILGALLTGVFASPNLGGVGIMDWVTMKAAVDYDILGQVWIQAKAVGVTIVWSTVVSLIAYKLVDKTIGLRVTEDAEREGLDISSHGEIAYI